MRWVVGVLPAVADDLVVDEVNDPARELVEDNATLVLVVEVPAEVCADADRANRKLTDSGEKSRILSCAMNNGSEIMIKANS